MPRCRTLVCQREVDVEERPPLGEKSDQPELLASGTPLHTRQSPFIDFRRA